MGLSYETAAKLFEQGEFAKIVGLSTRDERERQLLEPRHRVILANALAFAGEFEDAKRLAELDASTGSAMTVRSQAQWTLSLAHRRFGDLDSALRHAQAALHFAQESGEAGRVAWAHLHRFRLLIEVSPVTEVLATLADVRRAVARAGLSQATAYLHVCVAVLEGQTGRLDEARRHSDIADALLELSPNIWLTAASLVNRGCIACLNCEFAKAAQYLVEAKAAANRSGHTQLAFGAQVSLGHVQLLMGHFDKAKDTLSTVLNDATAALPSKLGASETLARTYLALNEVEKCERTLREHQEGLRSASSYYVRWVSITHARLLLRKGEVQEALRVLSHSKDNARLSGDVPLGSTAYMAAAQALAQTKLFRDAARNLLQAGILGMPAIRELQGQYYYGLALTLRDSGTLLVSQLLARAVRIWAEQGNKSLRLEMADALRPDLPHSETSSTVSMGSPPAIECVTDALASMADVAYKPRLLGQELLSLIELLDCATGARIVRTPLDENPELSMSVATLPLGVDQGRMLTLMCEAPDDPVRAVLLTNVLRIARSAIEREQLREEERNRAAIWPESAAEPQAGALFLAEDMQTLLATARRIAPTNISILITGETGTGKEVLARSIHAYSSRANATFLPFNCSSVSKDMLDAQLFGHRRGAFTGAVENFPGVIRTAAGGTLFLDEIGETTLDVQPKLLRFLDAGEVHPVGEAQPVKVDVRVIAATNADLDTLVAEGRFREDLFYRLNIVRLHVPPLRERRVEIPPLANHYLQKYAQEFRKGDLRFAEETMEYLVLYRWPGNVRQLANEMRRLAALAEAGAVLMPEHLSPDIAASRRTVPPSERTLDATEIVVRIDQPVPAAVQHLERAMIQYALRKCEGRMEETAALLGLSRKGLYLKRVRYGLEPPESAGAVNVA